MIKIGFCSIVYRRHSCVFRRKKRIMYIGTLAPLSNHLQDQDIKSCTHVRDHNFAHCEHCVLFEQFIQPLVTTSTYTNREMGWNDSILYYGNNFKSVAIIESIWQEGYRTHSSLSLNFIFSLRWYGEDQYPFWSHT